MPFIFLLFISHFSLSQLRTTLPKTYQTHRSRSSRSQTPAGCAQASARHPCAYQLQRARNSRKWSAWGNAAWVGGCYWRHNRSHCTGSTIFTFRFGHHAVGAGGTQRAGFLFVQRFAGIDEHQKTKWHHTKTEYVSLEKNIYLGFLEIGCVNVSVFFFCPLEQHVRAQWPPRWIPININS